jgi:hypothetical protein
LRSTSARATACGSSAITTRAGRSRL